MGKHPSHKTRFSFGASTFDEICELCGATDHVPGGWGKLAEPCPMAPRTEDVPAKVDEFKGTPGEWSVNDDPKHCGGKPTIVWGPQGPGYGAVAYTFSPGLMLPTAQEEEVTANAYLIAAAKDLLAALIKMRRTMYSDTSEESVMADAAIAKALGKK